MSLIIEYFELQKKYQAQYGERTILLMQVGSFYETYEYDPTMCTSDEAKVDRNGNVWNEPVGHSSEIRILLNYELTMQNKEAPYSIENPYKCGCPVIAYEKNRGTLLANDYLIVRMDQVKNGATTKGKVDRYVAEICSPNMHMDSIALNRTTNNIACLYIEYQSARNIEKFENFLITAGVSVVDVLTGQNRVCEFYSKHDDEVYAVQELYRFLVSHNPKELLVYLQDMPAGLDKHSDEQPNPYIRYLDRVLELGKLDRVKVRVNELPDNYRNLNFQTEFLNKIFSKQSQVKSSRLSIVKQVNTKIIEELGIERMNYGRVAYLALLQYCHSHNSIIFNRLKKPDTQWIDENKHLILTHNAIKQLDLMPPDGVGRNKKTEINSLMSVLDHTSTNLGKRALVNLLQNPLYNGSEIEKYYNMVDEMIHTKIVGTDVEDVLWLVLERILKQLPDVERLQRKLELGLITPKEIPVLYKAYTNIINIYVTILNANVPTLHKQMFSAEEVTNFNAYMSRYGTLLDMDALSCCSVDSSENNRWLEFRKCPIQPGYHADVDTQYQQLIAAEQKLQKIIDHLNKFLTKTRGKKICFTQAKRKQGAAKQDPTGTLITTTNSKANVLLASKINTELCGNLSALTYTTSEKIITSDVISDICACIDNNKNWLRNKLLTIFEDIIQEMRDNYVFYNPVVQLISKVDLIHCYAKISVKYKYHRPELVKDDIQDSFMEARDLRHPIIERLIDGEYIPNDISLGRADNNRPCGALLYGVNQTGKSSLAKAIGINIIMAQAGCYTACKLKYKPYSKIITRLSGMDNLFKNQSSFAVEMTELRTIMRQADNRTLVIGDELARGTESDSATSITISTILSLLESKSTFIFATHMHHLVDMPFIQNINKKDLRICHLSVLYDEESETLIYNRKLQEGPGSSVYGLMVARSLGLPDKFMDKAYEVLRYIEDNPQVLNDKKSRYNNKVYMDTCAQCNKRDNLHTHHINEQKLADDDGFIGSTHKNVKDNLIVLCQQCHQDLHKRGIHMAVNSTPNGKLVTLHDEVKLVKLTRTDKDVCQIDPIVDMSYITKKGSPPRIPKI